MLISGITEEGVGPALVKTLAFQEARLKMIAENVANAQTPGYRAKQLDIPAFQSSLREALARPNGSHDRIELTVSDQVRTDEAGFLVVTPSEDPVDQALFHDGTNISIEQEMSDLAQTSLWADLAGRLLQTKFEGLRKAIRGQA